LARGDAIDTTSFTPVYFQLGQLLHKQITSGGLRVGDRVPSENELSAEFGVSRMTARKALTILTDEGLVRREKGKGTFVSSPRVDGGIFLIPDFREEMHRQGVSSNVKLLGVKIVPAGRVPADRLGVRKGERVIYLERILEGGGEPLVFDRKYLILDRSQPLLEAELGHGRTEDLFANIPGLAPVRADLSLSATNLTAREAKLLEATKGAPAFCMDQLIYAANNRKVIWGWLIYRGDKFTFSSSSRLL
jgi:GntR family transcriptional regulator